MAFVLFILVNAVLLIRPAEILPALQGVEIYFYLVAACCLFASLDVYRYLTAAPLMPLCLYHLGNDKNFLRRGLWLATLLLFFYGIYLTKSRGGFLALLAGLGTLCWARYGWRRAALVGGLGLPLLLLVFAGRQ